MRLVLLALIPLLALNLLAFLPAAAKRLPRMARALVPAALIVNSAFVGLLALEAYFAYVHDQSDGFNLTYAGRTWMERHWRPVNTLGYRDAEPRPPAQGVTTLAVVGDSFAAGHGLATVNQRFGNILGGWLGPGWQVVNVAKLGWDTADELAALAAYPVKPDVVVLAYYLNDIYNPAVRSGIPMAVSFDMPTNPLAAFLVKESALVDFVYWRMSRQGRLSAGNTTFWEKLKAAYDHPAAVSDHQQEMARFAAYCQANAIRLVVLVIPALQDLPGSAPITAKVARAWQELGASAVIDLSPRLAGRNPAQLVVNAFDAHASPALNQEMAQALYEALQGMK